MIQLRAKLSGFLSDTTNEVGEWKRHGEIDRKKIHMCVNSEWCRRHRLQMRSKICLSKQLSLLCRSVVQSQYTWQLDRYTRALTLFGGEFCKEKEKEEKLNVRNLISSIV